MWHHTLNFRKNNMKKIHYIYFAVIFLGFLSGCSVSLAADVTPPPNLVEPKPNSPTAAPTVVLPMIDPDILNGEIIYGQKCAACHGEAGMGDGVQSGQLPNPVTPLGDMNVAREVKPFDWYKIITVGNFERFMPAFQSLSDRERWDVTAYALTLSLSEEAINNGKTVFSENCIECHTEESLPLQSASAMAEKSLSDILLLIKSGLGDGMPAFSDKLSDDEQLAVASYVRYLSISENNGQIDESMIETSDEPVTTVPGKFSIVGTLTNLDTVPQGIFATLSGYDGMEIVVQIESPVSNDGSFKFENLDNISGRIYQVTTVIDGIQQTSEVLHDPVMDDKGNVELPIIITKTSVDSSALYAERMHVFFDFTSENIVQIVEMYVIQNPTDNVIIPIDNLTPVIRFNLPTGAQNLQFEGGEIGREFIELEDGVGSMQPIGANASSQILFAFELPYEKSLDLDFVLPLKVNASIFMLPSDVVKFTSKQLEFSGERDVQGMNILTYSGATMDAGSTILMNISGKVKNSTAIVQNGDTTSLIIGGSVLLIAILVVILYFRKKLKKGEEFEDQELSEEDLESLVDAVIALDDAFQSGEIPEVAYHNRRNELTNLIKLKQNTEE